MTLKFIFDRVMAAVGLLVLWPVRVVVAVLVRVTMPGGPAIFKQTRVGRCGQLFTICKFRSMTVGHGGSSVSVAGESRITPFGAALRHCNFIKDIQMIFCTVLGRKMIYNNEII